MVTCETAIHVGISEERAVTAAYVVGGSLIDFTTHDMPSRVSPITSMIYAERCKLTVSIADCYFSCFSSVDLRPRCIKGRSVDPVHSA